MIVVSGKKNGSLTNYIEAVDLDSSSSNCQPLPNFLTSEEGLIGGLGFQEEPIICSKELQECFSLKTNNTNTTTTTTTNYNNNINNNNYNNSNNSNNNSNWISSSKMNATRSFAAVLPSPYQSSRHKFLVIGGAYNSSLDLNTSEVLTEHGWENVLPELPVMTDRHCAVLVNSTTVMVIGGWQNSQRSQNTFYFNNENENGAWIEGPRLKTSRSSQSCGTIRNIDAHGWNIQGRGSSMFFPQKFIDRESKKLLKSKGGYDSFMSPVNSPEGRGSKIMKSI